MSSAKSQERQARLKAALKENLKRRKAQARGREAESREDVAAASEAAARNTGDDRRGE
jgi:hypothetical protein